MIEPEANGKYVIKTPSFTSYFLPSQQEVSALLDLPDSFRKMIPLIEYHSGIKLNVGRSSRAKMHTDGFAKPTFKKLISWFQQLPISLNNAFSYSLLRKVIKAGHANSNAITWFPFLNSVNNQNYNDEFVELLSFIEERANADCLMLTSYKAQVKKGDIDEKSLIDNFTHQLPIWTQSSLIPDELFSDYGEILKLHLTDPTEAEKQAYKLLPAFMAMRFDFYLAAIANYEIGLALYIQRSGTEIDWDSFEGFMWPVIKVFAVSEESCHCFDAMLAHFKFILSKNDGEISWQKLASYIEINESGTAEITLKDKQRHQLNDWRRNENLPSDKKFRAFVEAAVKPLGHHSIEHILIYARISRGIDTLVSQTSRQFQGEHIFPAMADALSRYPEYLEYYKQQALLKQNVAA
ncbi:hypothetical protein [Moritella yayanosii]|nr:hypothetical protein [Moritella yayanosii]